MRKSMATGAVVAAGIFALAGTGKVNIESIEVNFESIKIFTVETFTEEAGGALRFNAGDDIFFPGGPVIEEIYEWAVDVWTGVSGEITFEGHREANHNQRPAR